MKKVTVLSSLVAAAGLATSVMAQGVGPANAVVEIRIVVDGTMGSPFQGGSNFFPGGSVSNPIPTAVGLTIQARVTTTGTFTNWGVSRAGFVGSPFQSSITHNDSVTNTTSALWTDVRNAFQRGETGDAGAPAPRRGLFNLFRNNVTTTQNIASGNGTFVAAFNNGLLQTGSQNAGTGLWTAGPASASNFGGIVGVDGNSPLQAVDPSTALQANGYGVAGATATDVVQGGWQNVYRFLFIPRTNFSDLQRSVTVAANFRLSWGDRVGDSSGVGEGPFNVAAAASTLQDNTFKRATVSFLVPTPGAAALLGLGGLAIARRRRA